MIIELQPGNHFIAMEYYGLILNRTFLILILDDYLTGIKVNGIVAIEGGKDIFTRYITGLLSIHGDLDNLISYVKKPVFEQDEQLSIDLQKYPVYQKPNFMIPYSNMKEVYYDAKKKWGMGYYPHDGKVYVKTFENKSREFIILGNQSGEEICIWIKNKLELLRSKPSI